MALTADEEERMPYKVTLIPGDGVGPELSEATRRVLEGRDIDPTGAAP